MRTEIRVEIHPRRKGRESEQYSASNECKGAYDSHRTYLAQLARSASSVERKILEEQVESATVEDESETGEQRNGAEEHILGDRYLLIVLIEAEEQDPEQDLHQVNGDIDGEEDGS